MGTQFMERSLELAAYESGGGYRSSCMEDGDLG